MRIIWGSEHSNLMEIKKSILGPDRAQIALQALFFQVSLTVQQSNSNSEGIKQHEIAIAKLQNKSTLLHKQAYSEIILRYPYSALRIEDEKIFRDMCLRTKSNAVSLEQEREISALVYNVKNNNNLGPDITRQVQSYVDFNITGKAHKNILEALRERETAAKKVSSNLRGTISRWIVCIKEALQKRKENWEKLKLEFAASTANETLQLLPNDKNVSYDDEFLTEIVKSSTSDHQLTADSTPIVASTTPLCSSADSLTSLYPTVDPLIFTTEEKEELGKYYYSK